MPQRITGHTELIGLIADPIRHSKSPMMHNTAFEALGLDYVYLVFEVDLPRLPAAVAGLRALGVRGFNVSMPLKSAILPLLDEVLPAGQLCQAVNTVVNVDGRFIGTSTDGEGFLTACRAEGVELRGKTVTLLGAGGAGTSVAMQAGLEGVRELYVFNRADRFWTRAQENVDRLNRRTDCRAQVFPLEDRAALEACLARSQVLVNATSAGFGAQQGACALPEDLPLRRDLVVADVIYDPAETPLLARARAAGCLAMNGLGMMLYQGAAAFRLWTGRDMPMEAVRAALEATA